MFVPSELSAASSAPRGAELVAVHAPRTWQIPHWGKLGNVQRIAELGRIGRQAGTDPRFRRLAVRIFREKGIEPRDYRGQAAAVLEYIREKVFFINERDEVLQDPAYTLDLQPDGSIGPLAAGDCDDFTMAMIAILSSIRLPILIVTSGKLGGRVVRYIEGQGRSPDARWSHVYTVIGPHPFQHQRYDPRTWLFADPTVPRAELGWDVVGRGRSDPQFGAADDETRIDGMTMRTALALVAVSVVSAFLVKRIDGAGWFG